MRGEGRCLGLNARRTSSNQRPCVYSKQPQAARPSRRRHAKGACAADRTQVLGQGCQLLRSHFARTRVAPGGRRALLAVGADDEPGGARDADALAGRAAAADERGEEARRLTAAAVAAVVKPRPTIMERAVEGKASDSRH